MGLTADEASVKFVASVSVTLPVVKGEAVLSSVVCAGLCCSLGARKGCLMFGPLGVFDLRAKPGGGWG